MNMADNQEIVTALRALGVFANGIIPSSIGRYEPTIEDANEFQNDLMLLAAKVDAVVEAYGEYLKSHGVLSRSDVDDCFRGQLANALQGNATFLIESGVQDLIDQREECAADDRADHMLNLQREAV
jgi:hypothetical protein